MGGPSRWLRTARGSRPDSRHAPAGRGEQAPGRTVPRALGLDPAAAGGHFAAMNRFARLSEQAGLTEAQRRQLLREVQENGRVSDGLRGQIEGAMRRQGGKRFDDPNQPSLQSYNVYKCKRL